MTASGRALLVVAVVSAGTAAFIASRFVPDGPVAEAPTRPGAQPQLRQQAAAPAPASASQPAFQAPAPAAPEPPRFDVVRVGARGVAVVAGRAAPGAEVVLLDDGREIGRARADARGEWVILPAEPLRPGSRQFTLRARIGGEDLAGPDVVVVVVPEAAPAVAEAPRTPAENAARAEAASRAEAANRSELEAREALAHAEASRREAATRAEAAAREDAGRAGASRQEAERAEAVRREAQGRAEVARREAEAARAAEARLPPVPSSPLVVLLPALEAPARVLQGQAQQRLGLEVVDYDDGGAIRFAGTAPPGATVRVYVDDQHAGDAEADAQGRWALAPREAPTVGRHRLRVDQVAAAGAVAARIEVPFQRDEIPEASVAGGRVVVQPGNNLWRLARAAYGRGVRYTVIYDANREQIRNPNMIFPGQIFAVPGAQLPGQAPATPADSSRSR
jgi:hypothetical protein